MSEELEKWIENHTVITAQDRLEGEVVHADVVYKKLVELTNALEEAKAFAIWVEVLGRTDCEIYKHELKASADISIERISKVLDI